MTGPKCFRAAASTGASFSVTKRRAEASVSAGGSGARLTSERRRPSRVAERGRFLSRFAAASTRQSALVRRRIRPPPRQLPDQLEGRPAHGLVRGTSELVAADVDFFGFPGPDRRLALTGAPMPGREAKSCRQLRVRDLVSGETKGVGPPGVCVGAPPAAVSGEVFAVPGPDGVLVGRVSSGAAHLLVGHEGPVQHVAVSPDGRWVATSGEDNTLRLWPMPDLSKPPLHTLPHDELLAKLHSLTNLRVVRAPESPGGWKIEVGPFPGWKDVPTW
jgi:hypothetical protein